MVVGGAGFIGSHLTERLLVEGHRVDVVDDLSSGSLANLAAARQLGGLSIHTVDATSADFVALAALRAPEVIIHLGWLVTGADESHAGGRSIASLQQVLAAARAVGSAKVVVLLPATALYGDVASKEQPIKERRDLQPFGVRGVLARCGLDLLELARSDDGIEFTALVVPCVYGRRQPPVGVVPALLAAHADGDVPVLDGDGRQTRDLVFIDDVVDAIVRSLAKAGGLTVNVGTGVGTSIRELWTAIAGAHAAAPQLAGHRPSGPHRQALAVSRARIQLGWNPFTSLDEGLRLTR
jgi:UDP-glucose 4-epimerase